MNNISQLTASSADLLHQLNELIAKLTDEEYARPLALLSQNTLAKHVRHVIELYEELLNGLERGQINYDARKRNPILENDRAYTFEYIGQLCEKIQLLGQDQSLTLLVNYGFKNEEIVVSTTLCRELAYNIEHAIHHMAILQIAIKQAFSHIELSSQFGVAFSTQVYLQKNVHA
jgi:uncharacterized damage-inducible protein DinB